MYQVLMEHEKLIIRKPQRIVTIGHGMSLKNITKMLAFFWGGVSTTVFLMIEHHSICELPRGVLFQITTKSRANPGSGEERCGRQWEQLEICGHEKELAATGKP